MAKGKNLIKILPRAERDILIFELKRQRSYWNYMMLMNHDGFKHVCQIIRALDCRDTFHGSEFWFEIFRREITPKWSRKY